MKKIYMILAAIALLSMSLNAQNVAQTKAKVLLTTQSNKQTDKLDKTLSMNQILGGINGMSSVMQPTTNPNGTGTSNGPSHAPLKLNAGEELVGPFTTYDTSISGYNALGFPAAYGGNYQQILITTDLDPSEFNDHIGDEIVGFRFALAGNTSQTAVLYDFIAWPYAGNNFDQNHQYTWSIPEVAGAAPEIGDITITVGSGDVNLRDITVYGDNNAVLTTWNSLTGATTTVNLNGTNYASYNMPTGWSTTGYILRWQSSTDGYLGYMSGSPTITLSSSLFTGQSSVRVVINASTDDTSYGIYVNNEGKALTSSLADYTWNLTASAPGYIELQAGQWYEYYLDEPVTFDIGNDITGMRMGYFYFQYPSTETSELLYPIAVNPQSTGHDHSSYMIKPNGTTYVYDDVVIGVNNSTYSRIYSITVTSGNTTITSFSYATDGGTLPSGWGLTGSWNIDNSDYLYTSNNGTIVISGDLLEGYSNVTVTISGRSSTRNRTAYFVVNGTQRTTTSTTATNMTWPLNGTSTTAYSQGWWTEDFSQYGDLAVQLIFKSSTNPEIEITPETQTINDAAAGTLTITGTDVEGNISVSAGNDWSLNPTSVSNTGGNVNVSYTGRALSASTTVTASATGATDATATVDYVADVYIVGDFGSGWDFTNGTHMTYNNGIYTATITANANSYILFARMLGNNVTWNTRYVFGPDSNGNWVLNGDSGSGTIDTNDDDPIQLSQAGTYTVTIDATDPNNVTFTITRVPDNQTATPSITYTDNGESVTITATGDGTVKLTVDGQTVSGDGSASITIPYGPAATTVTATATAKEDGKAESVPANSQVPIPGGQGWLEMKGDYTNPNTLLSFQDLGGEEIMLVDQFLASTKLNDHPDGYTYTLRDGEKSSTPVDIPVYKTSSTMQGFYTYDQVMDDEDMHLKAQVINSAMAYEVDPDHNTLYHSLYRGDKNAAYPVIDVAHRVSQLQKYEENVNGTVNYYFTEMHTSGVTPRYDHVANEIVTPLDTNYVTGVYGDEISYVPVIWTFGLYSGREDGKNNSYGSDIKREKLGNVQILTIGGSYSGQDNVEGTGNGWEGNFKVGDVPYCIYSPEITISGICPATLTQNDGDESEYEPFMYRAWCLYEGARDFKHVAQQNAQGVTVQVLADNGSLTVPYLMGTNIIDANQTIIGSDWEDGDGRLQSCFAVPVGTNGSDIQFAVRFYYKKKVTEGGTAAQGDGAKGNRDGEDDAEYYIVETTGDAETIPVSIYEFLSGRTITSVTYVNAQGMKSNKPFDGLNIVVTRYSDGTTSTTKVIK